MSQLFVTDREYSPVGHMCEKPQARNALSLIFQLVGVLRQMFMDSVKVITQGTWGKRIKNNQDKKNNC